MQIRMESSSAQPLLDRLEDETQDVEENNPDSGIYAEKSYIGRTLKDNNKRRYVAVVGILLFLLVFGVASLVYSSHSDAYAVEVVPEEEISDTDAKLVTDRPSLPLQLMGAPTESLWGMFSAILPGNPYENNSFLQITSEMIRYI